MSAGEAVTSKLLKSSYFILDWGGTEVRSIVDLDLPTMEYEDVEHDNGTKAPKRKSQGIPKYGDLRITRNMKREQEEVLYNNFKEAQTAQNTDDVKVECLIFVKDAQDQTLWKLKLTGCWVKEYDPPTFGAKQSDSLSETFTVSVDYMTQEA